MIEREPEAGADVALDDEVPVAIFAHVLARLLGGQLGRRAVLVGGANEKHLMALQPAKARMHVRGQLRAGEIAQVLDAVDIGKRGRDEIAGHEARYLGRLTPRAQAWGFQTAQSFSSS